MFNPISLKVIRQALAWHSVPTPTHIHGNGMLNNRVGPLAYEYLMLFDAQEIGEFLHYRYLQGDVELSNLTAALQECFCDDIQVVSSTYDAGKNAVVTVFLVLPFVAEIS